MSHDNLYELFDTPTIEKVEPPVIKVAVHRKVGVIAGSLYELDFSADADEFVVESEHDEAPIQELTSIALAEVELHPMQQEISEDIQTEAQTVIEFPEHIVDRFNQTLKLLGGQTQHLKFSMFDMERLTRDMGTMTHQDRWYFKQYCKQHKAMDYFGDGIFGLAENITPETYWPGLTKIANGIDIPSLVENTVTIMSHTQMYKQEFQIKHILGIVKSQGIELYTDELNEFIAQLAGRPGVVPQENGSYRVTYVPDPEQSQVEKPLSVRKAFPVRQPEDISIALNNINRTLEMKRAKDLAINKAETRRKGRHRKKNRAKLQGRLHGKKQTFDQILKQSLANAPQPTTLQEIIVDGNIES